MQAYPMKTKVRAVMEYVTQAGRTHLQIGLAYEVSNRAISYWCRSERVIAEVAHRMKTSPGAVRGKITSKSKTARKNGRREYMDRFSS